MSNKSESQLGMPYGEIVLKPGDSRPIVVISQRPGGSVDISAGTVEDAEELELFCRMIAQVAHSAVVVRRLSAASQKMKSGTFGEGDDAPF